MCSVRSHGPAEKRHFVVSGGGVLVHQSWPEYITRACAAIRHRRMLAEQVNGELTYVRPE